MNRLNTACVALALAEDILAYVREEFAKPGDTLNHDQDKMNVITQRHLQRDTTEHEHIELGIFIITVLQGEDLDKDCAMFNLGHWLYHEFGMADTITVSTISAPASHLN